MALTQHKQIKYQDKCFGFDVLLRVTYCGKRTSLFMTFRFEIYLGKVSTKPMSVPSLCQTDFKHTDVMLNPSLPCLQLIQTPGH